jgi:uncharacterized repeat protein (TIGR01451 family)
VGPDLSILKTHLLPEEHCYNNCSHNDRKFEVGQHLTSIILVRNNPQADAVEKGNPIIVTDVIPIGLSDIHAYGQDWNINVSDEYSPALVTATYGGSYPVGPDTTMPPIYVNGKLTQDAVPSLTDSAMVNVPGDVDTTNNIATDTVFVLQSNHQHNNHHRQDHSNSQHNNNRQDHGNNQHNNNRQDHGNSQHNNNDTSTAASSNSTSSSYPALPHTGSDPFTT